MYQISLSSLLNAIKKINHMQPVVAPVNPGKGRFYLKYFPVDDFVDQAWFYSSIRTPQPLKSFFYPAMQSVAVYPDKKTETAEKPSLVIIGAKACDLQALKIIDKVYREGDYPDVAYVKARKENIIISSDCTDAGDFCACTLMNCQPYARNDFDLNISPLEDNKFLIEIGSDRGKMIFNDNFTEFKPADDADIEHREKNRAEITEKVKKINEKYHYFEPHQKAIERHLSSKEWQVLSKTCVECGICTQICPTCHCFLLFDQPLEEKFERIKVWDSCFFAGYSRMAGGLTPRLSLADRFKNRFYHKFDSFVTNFGVEACTGCGRCSEGCMGNIDLRQVLLELEKRVVLKEKIDLE